MKTKTKTIKKVCAICGKSFRPKNNKGKFCSQACKHKSFRNSRRTQLLNVKESVIYTPRNVYMGFIPGFCIKIRSPKDTDISKFIKRGIGTEKAIKVAEKKGFEIERISME